MIAPRRDALSVDAGVERVWSAGRPVHHRRGEEVVGGGGLDAAEKLATVGTSYCGGRKGNLFFAGQCATLMNRGI